MCSSFSLTTHTDGVGLILNILHLKKEEEKKENKIQNDSAIAAQQMAPDLRSMT